MGKIIKILPSEAWDIITSPYKTDWRGVIFHHTAYQSSGDQGEFIERAHLTGERGDGHPPFRYGMGYHFLVNRSGNIQVGQRWPRQIHGAHCLGKNRTHIGMSFAGHLMVEKPTAAQIKSAVQLLFYLGHRLWHLHLEFSNTLCPGNNFNLMELKDALLVMRVENKVRADIKRYPLFKFRTKEVT